MPHRTRGRGEPSVEVELNGHGPIVHLTGDFDLATRDELKRRLALLTDSRRQAVVLDLTATTYLDSTIIGTLVDAHRQGLDFTIRGASGITRRTLELLAIPEVFPFQD